MMQSIRDHQIEQLLLNAHKEREAGVDLIEEYFMVCSSLDQITRCARNLLNQNKDSYVQSVILKNLSECIVVKMQKENKTFFGLFRRFIAKFGLGYKNREIERAEKLIQQISTSSLSDPPLSDDVFAAE